MNDKKEKDDGFCKYEDLPKSPPAGSVLLTNGEGCECVSGSSPETTTNFLSEEICELKNRCDRYEEDIQELKKGMLIVQSALTEITPPFL